MTHLAFTDEDIKREKERERFGNYSTMEYVKLDALLARVEAAEDIQKGERCEVCPDQGWYGEQHGGCDPDGENDTREFVQVQCQFCYENPKSVFNKVIFWRQMAGK